MKFKASLVLLIISYLLSSPLVMATKKPSKDKNSTLVVKATAFTSKNLPKPMITAWGNQLKPGMKAIAVSRDLLEKYGLKYLTKVKISGLEGEYLVLDKMHKRWERKIDIYMGNDHSKAIRFGKRKVVLSW